MAILPVRYVTLIRTYDEEVRLAEALHFPEWSRVGAGIPRLVEGLQTSARQLLAEIPVLQLHQRHVAGAVRLLTIRTTLPPPPQTRRWTHEVALTVMGVAFETAPDAHVGIVPGLDVAVLVKRADDLEAALEAELRHFLGRTAETLSLETLVKLARPARAELRDTVLMAEIPTPRQRARKAELEAAHRPDVLPEVATQLLAEKMAEAWEVDVSRLADAIGGSTPSSVLLVGPSGAGKTARVYEVVRRRLLPAVAFWETSGARLVAGMSGLGMWQERLTRVREALSKSRSVLYVGNLVELMEVGKSVSQSSGVAAFLRPWIARGDIQVIAECTPEQRPIIEAEAPQLLEAFQTVTVEEPDAETGRRILLNAALHLRPQGDVETEALETLERLHRRYATYSAWPGRPLRFLKNLCEDVSSLTESDVMAAFSRETGLPRLLLDDAVPMDVDAVHDWLAARVVGQPEATRLVADLLAMVKTGLSRPGRPIASLLLIGPTGVGKTEMARVLAEFLFSDRQRMTRFDMSEYVSEGAVAALVGHDGPLVARLREQPFTVLLLDEIEKAHPAFFDLLLQILGDARLSDARGRVADFRNALILMTSNLGAESFGRGAPGFVVRDPRHAARQHFAHEVQAALRPELFNRIDRIVPFLPLTPETVRSIVDRELARIHERDGLRYRAVTTEIAQAARERLAALGYDARYGARPLKRALERHLLVPLASGLNRYSAELPLTAQVDDKLHVAIKATDVKHPVNDSMEAIEVRHWQDLRRRVQLLETSTPALEIHNELLRLRHMEKRDEPAETRIEWLAALQRDLEQLGRTVREAEDVAFERLFVPGAPPPQHSREAAETAWEEALLRVCAGEWSWPDFALLGIYCEERRWMFALARAYAEVATARKLKVRVSPVVLPPPENRYAVKVEDVGTAGEAVFKKESASHSLLKYFKYGNLAPGHYLGSGQVRADADALAQAARRCGLEVEVVVEEPAPQPIDGYAGSLEQLIESPPPRLVGVLLIFNGDLAWPRFFGEDGLHVIVWRGNKVNVLVHAAQEDLHDYEPPLGVGRHGIMVKSARIRTWDSGKESVDDVRLAARPWSNPPNLLPALDRILHDRLLQAALDKLEEGG